MLFPGLIILFIGLHHSASAQDSTGTKDAAGVTGVTGATGVTGVTGAPDYKMAVGIRFSTAPPTVNNSISFKYFIDQTNAVEALASFGSRFGLGGL